MYQNLLLTLRMRAFLLMQKKLSILLISFCISKLFAQQTINYSGLSSYYMVERSDISRYDNDKYTGLLSREVRSSIRNIQAPKSTPSFAQNDSWYSGSFFVLEQTKSNQQNTSKGIDSNIDSTFRINANGEMVVVKDNGFPTFRSFPCYP